MEKISQIGLKTNTIKIIKGIFISILISAFFLFVYASILTYTNIKENTIPSVVISISLISILIGSFISSRNIKKNGIINGAIVGFLYVSLIYILSSFLLIGFKVNLYSIIIICGAVIAGMTGGIAGVNIR